jgi:putative transposase
LKTKGKAGFPRFQKKSRFDSAECRVGDGLTIKKSNRLGIVGISGEIRVKWHRTLPTTPTSAVLTRNNGKWYICFQVKLPDVEIQEPANPVGIDVGLNQLMALSDGVSFDHLRYYRKSQTKQRRLQRSLSRCKRNSKGRKKARIRLARHSAHVANQRRDHAHKLTTDLIRSYDGFAFENLQIKNMVKSNLAKSIHDAGWGQITSFIAYKAASAGMRCVVVDPRGTSQNCSDCGSIPLIKKTLAIRTHKCDECGLELDRDVNAARNILQRSRLGISPMTLTGGASKLVVLEATPFRGR